MTNDEYSKKICLNGWWEFQPVFEMKDDISVPADGWCKEKYLVPSFFTKPLDGIRKKGEKYYFDGKNDLSVLDSDDYEFLFDAYGYENEWSKTRTAWIKRDLTLDKPEKGRKYYIQFEAVEPKGIFFLNGVKIGENIHPTLPFETDVTEYLTEGKNEIAVLIADYEKDSKGRTMVPSGNNIPCNHSGIWQDVYLVERNDIFVSDVTIRTSVRENTVSAYAKIVNSTDETKELTIESWVTQWSRENPSSQVKCHLGTEKLAIMPFSAGSIAFETSFKDVIWWEPSNPMLYLLHTVVRDEETIVSHHTERFGFREVWIDGKDIMLNDYPIHLFSDWGHKVTPYHHTREWIQKWFRMIRDANMNHTRLHTHPHPKLYMELADELGILITGETGLHGSGGKQASGSLLYYERAFEHIEKFVRRDKNHPSIILWSVENEMRWNALDEANDLMQEYLPKLKEHFNFLDPTRPAYHEGDSSLWNERKQDIISRHYGKECSGIGWWDQKQPLHSGEMSLYHYLGPNNCSQLGGDEVFSNYEALDKAAALDTAYIVETGRTLGVSCFGPWNLSCLENLRTEENDISIIYDDYTVPGVKPLYVPAHSSEFAFYKEGKGYTPSISFDIQKKAFRPFAVIDLSHKKYYFENRVFKKKISVINDTDRSVRGSLTVLLKNRSNEIIRKDEWAMTISRGRSADKEFSIKIPGVSEKTILHYETVFIENEMILDSWEREITVYPEVKPEFTRIGIFGSKSMETFFKNSGVDYTYFTDWKLLEEKGIDIALVEPDEIKEGSMQNKLIREYVEKGGKVILLEQDISLFPKVILEEKQVLACHKRVHDHPVFQEISDDMLSFWGEDPYPLLAGDSYVATRMYRKDDGKKMIVLSDSGDGGFGDGNLSYTPFFEMKEGKGILLACQFRIMDKYQSEPSAALLFRNMLSYVNSYGYVKRDAPLILEKFNMSEASDAIRQAEEGRNVLVVNARREQLEWFNSVIGLSLKLEKDEMVYQAVRSKEDVILNGISNEDTCGVTTFCYSPPENINHAVGSEFIVIDDKCEILLETPVKSALKELFVLGGKSEILKTHTLSRFLDKEKPERSAVLSRIRLGEGAVYFLQFENISHFGVFYNRLIMNLGVDHDGSLLEGECVPSSNKSSEGYPEKVYVCQKEATDEEWENMLQCTIPSMERMATAPILNIGQWDLYEGEAGNFIVDNPDTYLYFRIYSPVARRNVETNLGVPNPMMLTFLDFEGMGEATVYVNGISYGTVKVKDRATISDISLEKDYNHVLIKWGTKDTMLSLKMQFRNIMRQPETSFRFL